MDQQLADLTKAILAQSESLKKLETRSEAIQVTVEAIKPVVLELQKWKPDMEQAVDGLRAEVIDLQSQMGSFARNCDLKTRAGTLPPILPAPEVKPDPNLMGEFIRESTSRREDFSIREKSTGEKFAPRPLSNNGIQDRNEWWPNSNDGVFQSGRLQSSFQQQHLSRPSKMDFPSFEGDNPKAWQLKCESYFKVCTVHPEFMVNVAAMYFVGGGVKVVASVQCTSPF